MAVRTITVPSISADEIRKKLRASGKGFTFSVKNALLLGILFLYVMIRPEAISLDAFYSVVLVATVLAVVALLRYSWGKTIVASAASAYLMYFFGVLSGEGRSAVFDALWASFDGIVVIALALAIVIRRTRTSRPATAEDVQSMFGRTRSK